MNQHQQLKIYYYCVYHNDGYYFFGSYFKNTNGYFK
jgi:hypothetical protein